MTKEDQDKFALESYKRSADAWSQGVYKQEVVPVSVKQKKGGEVLISEDEEYKKIDRSKLPTLRPVFQKEGWSKSIYKNGPANRLSD